MRSKANLKYRKKRKKERKRGLKFGPPIPFQRSETPKTPKFLSHPCRFKGVKRQKSQNLLSHKHAKIIVGTSPNSFGRACRRLPGHTLARCDSCVFERVRGSSVGHPRLGARVSAEHTRYRIQRKEKLKKHSPPKLFIL